MSAIQKILACVLSMLTLTIVLLGLGWFILPHMVTHSYVAAYVQNPVLIDDGVRESWHELLLSPDIDIEQVLADYALKHEEFSKSFTSRPLWVRALGINGYEGYVSLADLFWPMFNATHEEYAEFERYGTVHGRRIIPVFASDFSAIIDYFVMQCGA